MKSCRSTGLRRSLILLLALFAALLFGARGAHAQVTDYLIGPRDVVSVTVWDQADMSNKYTVEADGTFNFPFIGRVKAGGLTLKQLEAELKSRLVSEGFFKNPQISVAIDVFASQRVFVTGEVRTPGPQPLTGDMTLIEVLSRAGSTTPTASNEIIIVHAPAGQHVDKETLPTQAPPEQSMRVDLKDLQEKGLGSTVRLRDGDTIYVPKAETVYVFGQVKNPGAYALQTKDTTVLQALSLAGGVTDRGAQNRIHIQRIVNGKKVDLKVKDTDLVHPGDTIIVPERFF